MARTPLGTRTLDLGPLDGPLRFFVAEEEQDDLYVLVVHRSGIPVLGVLAEVFRERLNEKWMTEFKPFAAAEVLYELLPPLCEGCGQLVLEDRLCSHCHHQQVQDLLAIATAP